MTYADPMVTAPPTGCLGEYFMGIKRWQVYILYDIRITNISLQTIKLSLDKHGHFAHWNGLKWKNFGDREKIIMEYDRTYVV